MDDKEIINHLKRTINMLFEGRISLLKRIPEKDLTDFERQTIIISEISF